MKRSDRFYQKARRAALWACAILSASVAGCVWSVRVMQESMGLGFPCGLIALTGLFFFGGMIREAVRLARIANNEARWEWERSIRHNPNAGF